MLTCLVCASPISPFLSLGRMPIANGFLLPDQFSSEYFYDLEVGFCTMCYMVQTLHQVDREKMFHDHYAFFSSTSAHMANHFKTFAQEVQTTYLKKKKDPFVVEIGSNDGIFLQHIQSAGIRHLGIEPSKNVADVAAKKGIHTISQFFDEHLAREIRKTHGPADLFIGANVMCHIPYMNSVMSGVSYLLAKDGRLIFEDPYMGDIIEKTSYDQIYDEHALYFSVLSMQKLVAQHSLELVDVSHQDVHGGSLRYTIAHKGATTVSEAVIRQREKEISLGMDRIEIYKTFANNVHKSKNQLVRLLKGLKKQRISVAGYGATSKSTTILQYCGIGQDLISCIYDTTPIKIGTYTPGMHIPVKDYKEFSGDKPKYVVLFAWNHKTEIMEKESAYIQQGGKFITFVPRVEIIA